MYNYSHHIPDSVPSFSTQPTRAVITTLYVYYFHCPVLSRKSGGKTPCKKGLITVTIISQGAGET
jgi:hypothetical protein